jgi:hypothetical protein
LAIVLRKRKEFQISAISVAKRIDICEIYAKMIHELKPCTITRPDGLT